MSGQPRIMIVEDESVVALDMKMALQDMGYEVTGIAPTGIKALELVRRTEPDLIFMDILLEGEMDGIEVAEEIDRSYGIPFVYVTAHTDPGTMARASRTSHRGFIEKPMELESMHEIIKKALRSG